MGEARMEAGKASGARCPICGGASVTEVRPFCGKRCADVDLARWLSGVYVIPTSEDDDEDGERGRSAGGGAIPPADDEPAH